MKRGHRLRGMILFFSSEAGNAASQFSMSVSWREAHSCRVTTSGMVSMNHLRSPEKFASQFWNRVLKTDAASCWPWTGAKLTAGYGVCMRNYKCEMTHRLAYELTNGPIPLGVIVCHKCDNPPCCNPLHLFLGTHKDNAEDRDRKGRSNTLKGEKIKHAKLNEAQVLWIRAQYIPRNKEFGLRAIARRFDVSHATVGDILNKRTWSHL